MSAQILAWLFSFALLTLAAGWLGQRLGRGWSGILIDTRGRYSLTHFQVVLWSLIILSLIGGFFVGRLSIPESPLEFTIPPAVLILMGISLGGGAISKAIKDGKDATVPERIAASDPAGDPPRFSQIFLVEEGSQADKVIDVAKFQNFWLTIILATTYVITAYRYMVDPATPSEFLDKLPEFGPNFLALLGASHAGYLAGKLPGQADPAPGLTVAGRAAGAKPSAAVSLAVGTHTYVPRNLKAYEQIVAAAPVTRAIPESAPASPSRNRLPE